MKAKSPPAKSEGKGTPAVMIMIGLGGDKPGDDKGVMGADKPKPSLRGKVPGFGGKTRRSYVGP